jgi:hypothetical protein
MARIPLALAHVIGLALLAAAALDGAGVLPSARFRRERIVLTVRPRALLVDGLYVYENPLPFPRALALAVPWGEEEGQAPPAAIGAWRVDPASGEETPLPVLRLLGTPRVSLALPAGGEAHLRVRFEQRVERGRATYLLTTTAPWGRPLERGEYVVTVAPGARLLSSSYPLDATAPPSFTRTGFLPERDWTLAWEAAPAPGSALAASEAPR